MDIQGQLIRRKQDATKRHLTDGIAAALHVSPPRLSKGASVDSGFLDSIHMALTGEPADGTNAYLKTISVLGALGLTYDPYWDTSESAGDGDGTVTARAYSRIRSAITKTPRCFIINTTDTVRGNQWETDPTKNYQYATNVSGARALNDAGPGSLLLHYSTSKSTSNRQRFVSCAQVSYIDSGWTGPWDARLIDFTVFPIPVPSGDLNLPGWNRQNSIVEISYRTYRELVIAGGIDASQGEVAAVRDTGGHITAERVKIDFSPTVVPVGRIDVPESLPTEQLDPATVTDPGYSEDGQRAASGLGRRPRNASDRRRDKLAEERSIDLVTSGLQASGWHPGADRQADGVGYDLEFTKNGRLLKVEVKGVQSGRLAFNLTPKEAWRAETDPDWVVIAVTNVLTPTSYVFNVLTREQVQGAARVVTGFRLSFV